MNQTCETGKGLRLWSIISITTKYGGSRSRFVNPLLDAGLAKGQKNPVGPQILTMCVCVLFLGMHRLDFRQFRTRVNRLYDIWFVVIHDISNWNPNIMGM